MRPLTLTHRILFVALLALFAAQLIHVAHVDSVTWDEGHHLFDGYNLWTRHDLRLNPEVPPLVKLTAALPLLPLHLYAPPDQHRSEPKEAFLDGHDFLIRNGIDRVLFPARMACMLFALLLAVLVFVVARSLFGPAAALLALALLTFDPNLLAHGSLVTTDVPSACAFFAAIFAFYRFCTRPSIPRLLLAGLVTGLAFVTKFTGILLVPMLLLFACAEALFHRSLAVLAPRLAATVAIFLCGWIVLWAVYGFRYLPAPNGQSFSPSFAAYIAGTPNPSDAHHLALLARFHVLPQAYLWGLANTKITEHQYISYFFGHIYRHGPWQYFPAAFLIKSTLPLLLLLLAGAILWLVRARRLTLPLVYLLLPVAVYFAVITSSHFDIGARHLLPVYPFLDVLAGATAASLLRTGTPGTLAVSALLLAQVFTSLRAAPAYMAYGNEAWGGSLQVHRYLSDANTDWGQQLKAVRAWLTANHVTDCWFVYFADGVIEPPDYGIPCRRLPTPSALFWLGVPMHVPPVISGTVLISDSELEGVEFGDGPLNPYDSFRGLTPAAVIQGGVNVYRGTFAIPLAAALVDVQHADDFAQAGQSAAADSAALQAVHLAPRSALTQLALADRLAAHGDWPQALVHYRLADDLARTVRPDLQADDPLPRITAGLATALQHQRPGLSGATPIP